MNTPLLRTEGIGKRFGGFIALSDVTVDFHRDRLTAIIGPNGAGKSTFFNILSGALPATAGRILYEGRDITALPQHRFAHVGIAKSFQITSLFPQLSVLENVRVAAQAQRTRFNIWRDRSTFTELVDKAEELLKVVGLADRRHEPAGNLAHGSQRSLEIALALASEPRLLLLDEPTAGMSPEEARGMMDLIVRLPEDRLVVLVEHRMKLVLGISDRVVVLHHGQLLAEGSPEEIRKDADVRRVYLGQSV
jgi:branched-chain amino acid transport system ATP-binding protein